MSEFMLRLYTRRKSRGWSQSELAEKLGVSQSTVAMWEKGAREPNIDTLEAIADVFNVPLNSLISSDKEEDEIWELREQLRRRPEMRTLFMASKNATKEDLLRTIQIIEALKKASEYGNDDE